ncbi:MAG: tol-pal system protein YbgF, partial [Deltaproteobacteria bacterium]|nr:tol-pal system protein YbgF [Deltaproteobacteria bacterium]
GFVVILTLFLAPGCSWFGGDKVKRDEFDNLSGRVTKLEDTVYQRPGAAQGPGIPGQSGAPVPGTPPYPADPNSTGVINPNISASQPPGLAGQPVYPPGGQAPDPSFSAAFPPGATAPKASSSDRTLYNQAHALLRQKKYAQAANIFSQMLSSNPRGTLAPNARYWLGECRYAAGDFQGALLEFQRGLADYPQSNKAPDCLLKISYCQSRLGDGPGAMRSLNQLLAAYPNSPSATMVRSGRTRFNGN